MLSARDSHGHSLGCAGFVRFIPSGLSSSVAGGCAAMSESYLPVRKIINGAELAVYPYPSRSNIWRKEANGLHSFVPNVLTKSHLQNTISNWRSPLDIFRCS